MARVQHGASTRCQPLHHIKQTSLLPELGVLSAALPLCFRAEKGLNCCNRECQHVRSEGVPVATHWQKVQHLRAPATACALPRLTSNCICCCSLLPSLTDDTACDLIEQCLLEEPMCTTKVSAHNLVRCLEDCALDLCCTTVQGSSGLLVATDRSRTDQILCTCCVA